MLITAIKGLLTYIRIRISFHLGILSLKLPEVSFVHIVKQLWQNDEWIIQIEFCNWNMLEFRTFGNLTENKKIECMNRKLLSYAWKALKSLKLLETRALISTIFIYVFTSIQKSLSENKNFICYEFQIIRYNSDGTFEIFWKIDYQNLKPSIIILVDHWNIGDSIFFKPWIGWCSPENSL